MGLRKLGLAATAVTVCACQTLLFFGDDRDAGAAAGDAAETGVADSGAAADVADAAAPPNIDAGAGLACGDRRCDVGQSCCVDPTHVDAASLASVLYPPMGVCAPAGLCTRGLVEVQCNTPTFCAQLPGKTLCCVRHEGSAFARTECVVDRGTCDESLQNDVLCDPTEPIQCNPNRPHCRNLIAPSGVAFDVFGICTR